MMFQRSSKYIAVFLVIIVLIISGRLLVVSRHHTEAHFSIKAILNNYFEFFSRVILDFNKTFMFNCSTSARRTECISGI